MSTGDFAVDFGVSAPPGALHRESIAPRYPSFTSSRSPLLPLQLAQEPERRPRSDQHWSKTYARLLSATDALIAFGALMVGWLAANAIGGPNEIPWQFMLVGVVTWPLSIAARRGYDATSVGVDDKQLASLPRALADHVVASAFIGVVTGSTSLLTLMVCGTPLAALLGVIARLMFRRELHRQQRAGLYLRTVLVVGPREASQDLARTLSSDAACGLSVVGSCVPESDISDLQDHDLRVFGTLNEVPDVVSRLGCEAVAVTGGLSPTYLRGLAWSLEGAGVDLLVHPGLIEVAGPRMHIRPFVGLPLLHVEQPHFTGWRRTVKRAFDLVATSFGLLLIAPIVLTIIALIKLTDHGPVFFTQIRVGVDGRTFKMFKFRSMVVNAEALKADLAAANEGAGLLFKMKDDPRITRVGKVLRRYSFDELPQLFNVLRGEMSLVGPRPPLPSEVDQYGVDVRRRLLVKPGLTGLWQVSGRSLLSWDESVRLDLRYVENWSLSLDLLIMWKTAWAVAAKQGAF